MITPHEADLVFLGLGALIACACWLPAWVRARTRGATEADLDAAYDEGWDDAEAEMRAVRRPDLVVTAPAAYEVSGVTVVPPALPPGDRPHDWLTAVHELLAPEHIQDPSGPDQADHGREPRAATGEAVRQQAGEGGSLRAGGFDWPTDTALPAILNLGHAGDGTDRTFGRWQVAQWQHMQDFHADVEAWDRRIAVMA